MVILQTDTLAMLLQKNKCHLIIAVVNRLDNTHYFLSIIDKSNNLPLLSG